MIDLFFKGGPIMWPILAASIIALTVALERLLFLVAESARRDRTRVQAMLEKIEGGDLNAARQLGSGSRDFVALALASALKHPHLFQEAILAAARCELQRFSRGLPILDTIITLAPLLGLLGTVTGMIRSFGMLSGAELGAPAGITGGIAEALIATAFGLGVAITALLPFNFMNAREESARLELQAIASRVELLLKK
jgi:biopolymer transport protein ExbB